MTPQQRQAPSPPFPRVSGAGEPNILLELMIITVTEVQEAQCARPGGFDNAPSPSFRGGPVVSGGALLHLFYIMAIASGQFPFPDPLAWLICAPLSLCGGAYLVRPVVSTYILSKVHERKEIRAGRMMVSTP